MRCLEIFAGCGGLAFGLEKAGFEHIALVERDKSACDTLSRNAEMYGNADILRDDVRNIDWKIFRKQTDVLTGGPPCQPFSIGGNQKGEHDIRDMWPETIRAVRETEPKAFLFENVRNLAGPSFRDYLKKILHCLSYPEIPISPDEISKINDWQINSSLPVYKTGFQVLNAADYGASQIRNRVIISGIKHALNMSSPVFRKTHSFEKLLYEQWITGEYWEKHDMYPPSVETLSAELRQKIFRMKNEAVPYELPWKTVRDALKSLGEPDGINGHTVREGARSYKGHTGSSYDRPAKALKSGVHGVPGGENMIISADGKVRYFTVREAARLTGFPDDYRFEGSWSACLRQMGNAVPCELSAATGKTLMETLRNSTCNIQMA